MYLNYSKRADTKGTDDDLSTKNLVKNDCNRWAGQSLCAMAEVLRLSVSRRASMNQLSRVQDSVHRILMVREVFTARGKHQVDKLHLAGKFPVS